jgi:hypothetical protein
MNNPKFLRIVIAALAVVLCISLGFSAWALSDSAAWKIQVTNLAQYEGVAVAQQDFQAGSLRHPDAFLAAASGAFSGWHTCHGARKSTMY